MCLNNSFCEDTSNIHLKIEALNWWAGINPCESVVGSSTNNNSIF